MSLDTEKIKRIVTAVEGADVITIDEEDSGLVNSFDVTTDPNEVILVFSDDDGWNAKHEFTAHALSDAVVVDHSITLENMDGMDVEIYLYTLSPRKI